MSKTKRRHYEENDGSFKKLHMIDTKHYLKREKVNRESMVESDIRIYQKKQTKNKKVWKTIQTKYVWKNKQKKERKQTQKSFTLSW